jgi:hypothetical protein
MPFKLEFKLEPPGEKPLRRAFVLYKRIEDLTPAFERIIPAPQDYIARRIHTGLKRGEAGQGASGIICDFSTPLGQGDGIPCRIRGSVLELP